MLYLTIKSLHVTCVVLSISGFCLRGLWLLRNPAMRRWHGERRWLRALPHINDSLLLVAAIMLTVLLGQYPFVADWLTAKVLGLFTYILLGAYALRPGGCPGMRITAGLAAVAVFGWIVSVALSKHALGLFA
jgi:uncharacterized membrane protein SirB2